MIRRFVAVAASLVLVAGGSVIATPANAGGIVPIKASAPADPKGKLVGYSDPEDGKVVPVYEYTPPTLTKAEKEANLKKVTKGVKALKAAPPSPDAKVNTKLAGPWYFWAGGRQNVAAEGLYANCNLPVTADPYLRPDGTPAGVEGDAHSLCELAVMDTGFGTTRDIVEIGWIKNRNPAICPTGSRCLFGFYWVDGAQGAGYNANFVDNAANPNNLGKVLSATCSGGNTRFGIQYYNADWWLWFDECTTDATAGDWVGYYDGSLWGGTYTIAGTVDAFGEVASGVDSNMCSDMGNGFVPTATNGSTRIGTVQLINAAAAPNFTMYQNSSAHGVVPTAYNSVASNTPTTTYRFGGPGYKANNTLPGNTGSC